MGALQMMKNYISSSTGAADEIINIEDAFLVSPKTPIPESKVSKMEVFDQMVLCECILSNIRLQHENCQGGLTRKTWHKLLKFLSNDFTTSSDTLKIYLQVLIHFSKISIHENTPRSYGFPKMGKLKFFNVLLNIYIDGTLEEISENCEIRLMEREKVFLLKKRLQSKAILEAIRRNISDLDEPDAVQIDISNISKIIQSGCIYEVMYFNPFDKLRGAVLHNGIMLCLSNVAHTGRRSTMKYDADLITLAAHEFSHFIVRLVYNNFNFSSPWTNRTVENPRFDFGNAPRQLETGRNTELILFDGIQPDWMNSGVEAATEFINRIDSNCPQLPIISKHEFEELSLSERDPSSYFGIDVKPHMRMLD